MTTATIPRYSVHERDGAWHALWREGARQLKRRVGPSRGAGRLSKAAAWRRAEEIVREHAAAATPAAAAGTFRRVAHDYLEHLERVRGARPSTLRDHRAMLAEPGVAPKKHGAGESNGYVMHALGDMQASSISASDVEALLAEVERIGASPRTVNKYRATVSAVFGHGVKRMGLLANPAAAVDKRREPQRAALDTYTVDEVERLAEAMPDKQDKEIVRVAAYTGLRQGELLALRWGDVGDGVLTVSRALSAGVESGTKSHKIRHVPLATRAAYALARLRQRGDFTGDGELVFCNWRGRALDGGALTRRFKAARDAAGLRPLRFHDLRHTFGSLLAQDGVDVLSIKEAMGHSDLATTQRYLHARQASEQVERFSRALGG